jgi:putative colanic acid biosynthesis glycosyltransferase
MRTIFQINVVVNYGSTGRIAEEIGQQVIAKGWISYIAYGRKEGLSTSNLIRIGSDLSIKIHGFKTRIFDRHGFGSECATRQLIERIKEIKPDIIHLHNLHGYYINIDILFNYLSMAKIPLVWTLHDCWPFTGHCSHFDFIDCNKWETGCYSCPQKNEYPASFWLDNSKQNYFDKQKLFNSVSNLTIVPVSAWLSNLIDKSFLKNFPRQLIYNGINLTTFSPQGNTKKVRHSLGVGNRFMVLGVASVWGERKGLTDFIKLSKKMDQQTVIVLVGLNRKQLKDLPSNIIGLPRTESVSQLAEIYSASDLFLNLTFEDNFPTTNLESLACGTPILTYNTGGSIEAISSDTGFIVEPGDLPAVIAAIEDVRKNEKSSYTISCRDRAVKLYDEKDRYLEYIHLYESLLQLKN